MPRSSNNKKSVKKNAAPKPNSNPCVNNSELSSTVNPTISKNLPKNKKNGPVPEVKLTENKTKKKAKKREPAKGQDMPSEPLVKMFSEMSVNDMPKVSAPSNDICFNPNSYYFKSNKHQPGKCEPPVPEFRDIIQSLEQIGKKVKKKSATAAKQRGNQPEQITFTDAIEMNRLSESEQYEFLWDELREHLLYLYKIGRETPLTSTIVERVKYLIDRLGKKGIETLFVRLEFIICLVIDECMTRTDKIFVGEIRNATTALNFLQNIMSDFDNIVSVARKMKPMLGTLETYLNSHNISWLLLHKNLFRLNYLENKKCRLRIEQARVFMVSNILTPSFLEMTSKFRKFMKMNWLLAYQWNEVAEKFYKTLPDYAERKMAMHSEKSLNKAQLKKMKRQAQKEAQAQQLKEPEPPPTTAPPVVNNMPKNQNLATANCGKMQTKTQPTPKTTRKSDTGNYPDSVKLKKEKDFSGVDIGSLPIDEIVAFVEGVSVDESSYDRAETKKLRKKQKKLNQENKKLNRDKEQEQEKKVPEFLSCSPEVTITMVKSKDIPCENIERNQPPAPNLITIKNPSMLGPAFHPEMFTNCSSKPQKAQLTPQVVPSSNPSTHPPEIAAPTNPGSRMVTIRRVTEGNADEPTVTITLKGATPDQDQVLYRIINGQADYGNYNSNQLTAPVQKENDKNRDINALYNSKVPLSKSQRKRAKKNAAKMQAAAIINNNTKTKNAIAPKKGKTKSQETGKINSTELKKLDKKIGSLDKNVSKSQSASPFDYKNARNVEVEIETVESRRGSSGDYVLGSQRQYQYQNMATPVVINSLSKAQIKHRNATADPEWGDDTNSGYHLIPENLRLPAGITITKVPPTANKQGHECKNTKNLDALASRQAPIGTGVPAKAPSPSGSETAALFYETTDGRVTIRGPSFRTAGSQPLNPVNMFWQDVEMGVRTPELPFWWPAASDNVFAPKDIDLEDNSLDAEERELEAFKRFCQEPVPPQRQEVTHLNVQNIVIKKNQNSS